MRFGFLVLAACMVLVLGCPQPMGVMDGVRINSFGFDSSTISEGEEVELSLEIENVGVHDSDEVSFYVYGYDSKWNVGSYDVSGGSSGGVSWDVDSLRGRRTNTGVPGASASFHEIFTMPEKSVASGITQNYMFYGRLCYRYETTAYAMLKAVSASQRRDEKRKGVFSQGGVSLKNSNAPIQIELRTKSPIVFYESEATRTANLALIIRNVGGGYPCAGECSRAVDVSNINKLFLLEVDMDGTELSCDTEQSDDPKNPSVVSFHDGEAVVYCTYTVSGSQPKGEYLFTAVATYNYYVDRTASVNVVGHSEKVTSSHVSPTPSDTYGDIRGSSPDELVGKKISLGDVDFEVLNYLNRRFRIRMTEGSGRVSNFPLDLGVSHTQEGYTITCNKIGAEYVLAVQKN